MTEELLELRRAIAVERLRELEDALLNLSRESSRAPTSYRLHARAREVEAAMSACWDACGGSPSSLLRELFAAVQASSEPAGE